MTHFFLWRHLHSSGGRSPQAEAPARGAARFSEGINKDITLWADDAGRTSWMERFIDYLKAHGIVKDLSFMSFEHYPFMINGANPPWATLYMEPGIMKHVLHMWRQDSSADVPLIVSESGIAHQGPPGPGYLGAVTGEAIWECDAFGTFFERRGGAAFYRPAINNGADRWRREPRPRRYGPDGGRRRGRCAHAP